MSEIWHEGEKRLHRAVGLEDRMQERGAIVIREAMPEQHRRFFESLGFVVLSVLDDAGWPLPILRFGEPGFMVSPEPGKLEIASEPLSGEPETLQLGVGDKISVLGIELQTRRRNRINGTITQTHGHTLIISVDQSYGNCPRYIHRRGLSHTEISESGIAIDSVHSMSASDTADPEIAIQQIRDADTFFIASRAPEMGGDPRAGVDVNHRGGKPGFVKVLEDKTLVFPDYEGNNFFNTFGNIVLDARVGLLFPDFDSGALVAVKGRAQLEFDAPENVEKFGASRIVRVQPDSISRVRNAMPLRYELEEISRYAPEPGQS